ncbi:hypothetical protein [Serratia sp. Se-RSBMAAmG]|uniref:hypothetical protein n=1 Tax=Serratia sp. Se-RSBMAAmG TaxID=3043305 RepID=UPI0024AF390A|nr:hypothetical protein [Serratia sp. Se-RSBMAAmG]MDI6975964.1 hypothetical protein [Serratia sp. Se-RSBMAAmG]
MDKDNVYTKRENKKSFRLHLSIFAWLGPTLTFLGLICFAIGNIYDRPANRFINTSSSDYRNEQTLFSEAKDLLQTACHEGCERYFIKKPIFSRDVKLVRLAPVMTSSSRDDYIIATQRDVEEGKVVVDNYIAIVSFNDGKPELAFMLPKASLFPIFAPIQSEYYQEIRKAQYEKYNRYLDIQAHLKVASNIVLKPTREGVIVGSADTITSVPMKTFENLLNTINDEILEKTPDLIKQQADLKLWQDAKS